jgi:hypothetical protein
MLWAADEPICWSMNIHDRNKKPLLSERLFSYSGWVYPCIRAFFLPKYKLIPLLFGVSDDPFSVTDEQVGCFCLDVFTALGLYRFNEIVQGIDS